MSRSVFHLEADHREKERGSSPRCETFQLHQHRPHGPPAAQDYKVGHCQHGRVRPHQGTNRCKSHQSNVCFATTNTQIAVPRTHWH